MNLAPLETLMCQAHDFPQTNFQDFETIRIIMSSKKGLNFENICSFS